MGTRGRREPIIFLLCDWFRSFLRLTLSITLESTLYNPIPPLNTSLEFIFLYSL